MTVVSGRATLRGRDLLSAADFSAAEVGVLFETAGRLKAEFSVDRRHASPPLTGRTLAMLFQKPSLRTRVTFEAGMAQLGGTAIYIPEDAVMGARASLPGPGGRLHDPRAPRSPARHRRHVRGRRQQRLSLARVAGGGVRDGG